MCVCGGEGGGGGGGGGGGVGGRGLGVIPRDHTQLLREHVGAENPCKKQLNSSQTTFLPLSLGLGYKNLSLLVLRREMPICSRVCVCVCV